MALQKTINVLDNQITMPNAYLKIVSVTLLSWGLENYCNVTITAYKDKDFADNNKSPIASYTEVFTPIFGDNVKDIKAQAYDAIKQVPFYADAIDVFEEGQAA